LKFRDKTEMQSASHDDKRGAKMKRWNKLSGPRPPKKKLPCYATLLQEVRKFE